MSSKKDKSGERMQTWFIAVVLFIFVLAGIVIGRLAHQGFSRSEINPITNSGGKGPAK